MTCFSAWSYIRSAQTSSARRHHRPSPALQRFRFLAGFLASLSHLPAQLKHLKPFSKVKRMVRGRKNRAAEMGRNDRDEALWQRVILMGDKCQPLDFSGVIYYDESGNQILELPSRSPRSHLPSYLHAR